MSIFAKKPDPKHSAAPAPDVRTEPDPQLDLDGRSPAPAYGIAEAMVLMRSLPLDQNLDLVVRVVRVTLSSVNVRIEDIVEDATRRQKTIQDNIAALHGKVADLEDELDARRREIAAQEADFKETSSVKERLLLAEKSANFGVVGARSPSGSPSQPHLVPADAPQSPQPPPPPPPRALPKPAPRE